MFQTISVGPVTLHGYGLILGIAIAVGWWWAGRLWRQQTPNPSDFDVIAIWGVVGGIIGARIYHVVDYWQYYQGHIAEIMAVWRGGLAIWGAVLGGGISLYMLSRWKRLPLFTMLDVVGRALPLSQAIGRWGNWVNFELYGKPTMLSWGWWIPPQHRPLNMLQTAYYHPLFLYESLLSLGLFFILNRFVRKRFRVGSGGIIGGYLIGYGLIRFFLEPLRINPWRVGGLPMAQLIAVIMILVGLGICLRVGLDYEKETPET